MFEVKLDGFFQNDNIDLVAKHGTKKRLADGEASLNSSESRENTNFQDDVMARRLVVALVVRHVVAKSLDQVEDPSVYLDSRFRLKPGCVDAYVERGGDGRFLDPDYELRTREALRFGAAPRHGLFARLGTLFGRRS